MSTSRITSTVPTVPLNDGQSIPQLGFGVFQIEPAETAEAVRRALEVGYRHIDTAEMYGNERGVGEAVRASGLDRAEVFITSKLNNGCHRPDDARRAFEGTLTELGFDYVDLFLIHWPLPTLYDGDFVSTWKTLEEFQDDGRAHIQRGNIVSPSPRLRPESRKTFALFDFQLASDDIAKIDTLDRGEAGRTGPHPDTFAHIPS